MITVQELARRLSTLAAATFTEDDVMDLATTADVRINPDVGIDATAAQHLLDHLTPAMPTTGSEIVAPDWPPPTSARPSAPPVVFSSPGAPDGPADHPDRSRGTGPTRTGRRPDSRRNGR